MLSINDSPEQYTEISAGRRKAAEHSFTIFSRARQVGRSSSQIAIEYNLRGSFQELSLIIIVFLLNNVYACLD